MDTCQINTEVRQFLTAFAFCIAFGLLAGLGMLFWPSPWTLLLIFIAGVSFAYLFYRIQVMEAVMKDTGLNQGAVVRPVPHV